MAETSPNHNINRSLSRDCQTECTDRHIHPPTYHSNMVFLKDKKQKLWRQMFQFIEAYHSQLALPN